MRIFSVSRLATLAGRGGSRNHAERRALDSATLDRFKHIAWEYDWTLVRKITLAINPDAGSWVDWVIMANGYCSQSYPHVQATPRACFDADLIGDFTYAELAEMTVFKGLYKDSVKAILNACPLPAKAA